LQRFDHELKNPLTAIRFALANLLASTEEPNAKIALQSIEGQVTRIGSLLNNLRKLTELSQATIEHSSFSVNSLIEDALTLVRENYPNETRNLFTEIECTRSINGDKYLLLVALYNVIDNAFKYTYVGDTITISAEDIWDDWLQIRVTDTGIGIPEAEIDNIWKELYRAPNATHIPGSGVGLALVKSIVEMHHGEVWLESDPESGTQVVVQMPYDTEW
jgi:two-component system OmpR family sensor kinase